jgi:hypothetical protein
VLIGEIPSMAGRLYFFLFYPKNAFLFVFPPPCPSKGGKCLKAFVFTAFGVKNRASFSL